MVLERSSKTEKITSKSLINEGNIAYVFFVCHSVVYSEFLLTGKTVNKESYLSAL